MKCYVFCIGTLLIAGGSAISASGSSPTSVEFQSFDSEAAATAAGWQGFGNRTAGQNFGFSDTNHTGFASSPAGEAGGIFHRTPSRSFYGDTSLGRVFTLNDRLHAEGELAFVEHNTLQYGVAIFLGFFNSHSGGSSLFGNTLGMGLGEPLPIVGNSYRVSASYSLADGSVVPGPTLAAPNPIVLTAGNTNYKWAIDYDPTGGTGHGRVMVQMFSNTGNLLGTRVEDLTAAKRAIGATFDAFGLSTLNPEHPGQPDTITMFIDNISYTAIPEPSSLILAILTALALAPRWLRRSRIDLSDVAA